MLIASTPEGARDFVVPSRLRPGSFYALPQSPQLFKQLLDGRRPRSLLPDRALPPRRRPARRPPVRVHAARRRDELRRPGRRARRRCRVAVLAAAEAVRPDEAPTSIPRMTWLDAMERYGSDKPDTRFGMELVELTEVFEATEFKAFAGAEAIKGIRVEGEGDIGRSKLDALTERAKSLGAPGLVWMRVRDGGALESPVVKFLLGGRAARHRRRARRAARRPRAARRRRARDGPRRCWASSGSTSGGRRCRRVSSFSWIVDFPLFEGLDADGRPMPAHHAFTAPHPDDVDRLESDPLSVRSRSYDLVLNGWELGSGSVRIHRPDMQQRIFSLLGIDARGGAEAFRLPARRVPLRRAAARRLRGRHRPSRRDPRRRGEHPRGHRVPEDAVGRRPPHQRPHPDRRPANSKTSASRLLPPK